MTGPLPQPIGAPTEESREYVPRFCTRCGYRITGKTGKCPDCDQDYPSGSQTSTAIDVPGESEVVETKSIPLPSEDTTPTLQMRIMLADWQDSAAMLAHAHYRASVALRHSHYNLGLPTVVASAIVGTAVVSSMNTSSADAGISHTVVQLVVGALSLTASVLAALQTFLRFSERAEMHRRAASEHEGIAREAEVALAMLNNTEKLSASINSIRSRMDAASLGPELPERYRAEAHRLQTSLAGARERSAPEYRALQRRRRSTLF